MPADITFADLSTLEKRAAVLKWIRQYFSDQGFLEIQTPILSKSVGESSRYFSTLTSANSHPSYDLVYSPQAYKQLLISRGVKRYFQIAPCFRPDMGRPWKSPGEFYQLDFEIADADESAVKSIVNMFLEELLATFLPNRKITVNSLDYETSVDQFGVERPLRVPLFPIKKAYERNAPVAHLASEGAYLLLDDRPFMLDTAWLKEFAVQYPQITSRIWRRSADQEWIMIGHLDSVTSTCVVEVEGDVLQAVSFLGLLRDRILRTETPDVIDTIWIDRIPMFERGLDGLSFSHNAYSAVTDDLAQLPADPLRVTARQYDLVVNGSEIGGGAVRNGDLCKFDQILAVAGRTGASEFEWYRQLLANNFKPSAGCALGLERLLMLVLEKSHIGEVSAFPLPDSGHERFLSC